MTSDSLAVAAGGRFDRPGMDPQPTNGAAATAINDRDRRLPLAIFLVALLIFSLAGLRRDLWAPDEPRHAEVAAEMVRTGDYVVPRLNGEVYPDKPPLPFWIMSVPMRIFGDHSEWAARLPYAIAAALALALTFALARRFFGSDVALTAALLLGTAGQFAWLSQRVSLDIFQTLFVLLAIFAWVREARGESASWKNGLLFFTACGLGLSTKGPTALLVPFSAVIAHGLATGTLRRLGSRQFLPFVVVMLGIVASWLVPATLQAGEGYARAILGDRSFGRFTTANNHDQPFWYYFKEWPVEFLPWSPAFLCALWLAWKRELPGDPAARRLLLGWILVPFVVLSIAATKRGNYLMPLYPAAAILAAHFVHSVDRLDSKPGIVVHAIVRVLTGLIALVGVVATIVPFTPLLEEHHLPNLTVAGPIVGIAVSIVGIVAFRRGGESILALHRTLAVGLIALVPWVGSLLFPVIDAEKSDRRIAEKLLELVGPHAEKPIAFLRYSPEASRFYSQLSCIELRDRDELAKRLVADEFDYAVIESDKWEKLSKLLPEGVPLHTVGEGRAEEILIVDMSR